VRQGYTFILGIVLPGRTLDKRALRRYNGWLLVLTALDSDSLTAKDLEYRTQLGRSQLFERLGELIRDGCISTGPANDGRVTSYVITEKGKGRLILPGVLTLEERISSLEDSRLIESHTGKRGITKVEAVFSKQRLPSTFYAYTERRVKGGQRVTLRAKIPNLPD